MARRFTHGGRVDKYAMQLIEDRLYIGDNGRIFCGSLRCAGMTAYYSGRDLSGQRVLWLSPEAAAGQPRRFACEGCGRLLVDHDAPADDADVFADCEYRA